MHHSRRTAIAASLLFVTTVTAQDVRSDRFERAVRPLLVARCVECHGPKKQKSGLRLDHGDFIRRGGARGPALIPGEPDQSLMIQAARCEHADLAMPPKGQLSADELAILEDWVEDGAYWPDEPAPSTSTDDRAPFDLDARRASHWCWDAPAAVEPPDVEDTRFVQNPIDRFVRARLENAGLDAAPAASREAWLRRLTFDLTGLPPTVEAVHAFVSDPRSDELARADVVDAMLPTLAFGERFARHWLDLVRYAETMGHEFDFPMAQPWRYRDYLIRAFRDDVPYDQLIHEHIAGDLLPEPRRDPETDLPESPIGTASFWFMDQTHSPVESRQALSDRIDNAIDVTSKTFLGVTVACARCHDHKFDAISTEDYYALFGVLESSRYTLFSLESRAIPELASAALDTRQKAAAAIFDAVEPSVLAPLVEAAIEAPAPAPPPADEAAKAETLRLRSERISELAATHRVDRSMLERFAAALHADGATLDVGHPMHPLRAMAQGLELGEHAWTSPGEAETRENDELLFDPARDAHDEPGATWFTQGAAFGVHTDVPTVTPDPASPRVGILAGTLAHSGAASPKLAGTLHTRDFAIERRYLHVLAAGDEGRINVVVDGFNLIRDPIYGPLKQIVTHGDLRWHTFDLRMWTGHRAYLQAVDAPAHDPADPSRGGGYKEDAWLAVGAAILSDERRPPPSPNAQPPIRWLGKNPPTTARELGGRYAAALEAALADLRRGRAARPGALALVGWLGQHGLLPGVAPDTAARPLSACRDADAAIPSPTVLGATTDGPGITPRVHIRGSHRTLGTPVARRFLSALDDREFAAAGSGRLELARHIASPDNPLTARVIVNRLWHHLFGAGLVPTVDNLGVLGKTPTHPELLDWLATRFVEDGWSIHRSIRRMVLSETYAMSSRGADPAATAHDPENALLHAGRIRRLQGEAIRDALLALSGRLDRTPFGPPVAVHLTPFMDGRGRPGRAGPLDGAGRRSVYLEVRRNFLEPMFLAFDTPAPFSTVGARGRSNVPAQALTMMNAPLVHELTRAWSERVLAIPGLDEGARVRRMYREAFAREPRPDEAAAAAAFLAEGGDDAWAAFAHVLANVKEFVFIP
ncbi:MAG: PSD1 and planctomycete cytochrome C domain-containing protein [Planctomycetota bacterium]|nr:PSD1 and planctomycete cytochrome C domain-containing protein [Planctomycetota bacterium]MDA0932424.1 PSD1 and planctomycete cytochrome C domain-containing protein [Planctomycetota bacterium]